MQISALVMKYLPYVIKKTVTTSLVRSEPPNLNIKESAIIETRWLRWIIGAS